MGERRRILALILIMATVALVVAGIAIYLLYRAAFEEERLWLVETAQSRARLIEAMARFDNIWSQDYPGGAEAATLSQIIDAHSQFKGFGETGEFTLARLEGDSIVFLVSHRHSELAYPEPVPFKSEMAEPMRQALLGQSGSLIGYDYRGEVVLAAYEPVAELNLGIVAKIDMSEVNAPFFRAGLITAGSMVAVILLGTMLFLRISNPIIRRLREYSEKLEGMVAERTKELRGEITERRRAEEETRLLQTLTQIISESQDFDAALGIAIDKVCQTTGWDFGEAWVPSHDGKALECSPVWYSSSSSLKKFRKLSEELTFPPNAGLSGRVWSSKQPEWIPDVSSELETYFLRAKMALEAGLKAGFGVPIIDNGQVLAVLTFFMFESREEDSRLVKMVSSVAAQLGSVIQRKRAEGKLQEVQEKLITAERLATLGQFAGSISHELRNSLGVIDSSAYYLKRKLKDADKKTLEHLDRIESSVDSSTTIIDSLFSLTRMKEPQLKKHDLVAITHNAIVTFKLPATVNAITSFPEEELMVSTDQEQLHVAFQNIIKNAVEAMDDKGTLTVTIQATAGDQAEVSFADTGLGIAAENLGKIFQPLFSTKARGIGFGLAIVKMVIDKHGGTIEAQSKLGKGAIIIIRLPLYTSKDKEV